MERGVKVDRKAFRLQGMAKSIKTAARLLCEQHQRDGMRYRAAMITLTYREELAWEPRELSDFLMRCRKHLQRRGLAFRYVWVAELTKRGALHYHVLVWLPHGVKLPKPDSAGWWKSGLSRIEWARKAVGYLAKYASKATEENREFPRGCRISGNGGLDKEGKRELRWWRAPVDARAFFGPLADIRRTLGGRVDATTGEFWASPWRFVYLSGHPYLIKGAIPCV